MLRYLMSGPLPLEVTHDAAPGIFSDGIFPGMRLPLPRLGGKNETTLFHSACAAGEAHGFRLFTDRNLLIGYGAERVRDDLEQAALRLYQRLFAAAAGRPLYRIWNFIPNINDATAGLEGYQAFSAGRSRAFEETFGPDYRNTLCSASAVGFTGQTVTLTFVAGDLAPRHFENPEQVPAYNYPPEHGPRPPSFSRATSAIYGNRPLVFISGTAAIKGHQTIAPGALDPQLDCTLDNLRLVFGAAGMHGIRDARDFDRHFKIYLRHAEDFPRASERVEAALLGSGDHVTWLRADLCRAALNIEIEATLVGR